jgi:hypothetical protein
MLVTMFVNVGISTPDLDANSLPVARCALPALGYFVFDPPAS